MHHDKTIRTALLALVCSVAGGYQASGCMSYDEGFEGEIELTM